VSDGRQAEYLIRHWLFNIAHDIDLNIWYDWHDDGPDPDNPEHNFGMIKFNYAVKAGYRAVKTMTSLLDGYRFLRRIPLADGDAYLLLFQKDANLVLVVWTTSDTRPITLPLPVNESTSLDLMGGERVLQGSGVELTLDVGKAPQYLILPAGSLFSRLGGWRPKDTINCFSNTEEGMLPVIFESGPAQTQVGELQAWIGGRIRGTVQVAVPPGTQQTVYVPLDLSDLEGTFPGEIRWLPQSNITPALQRAAIWVQVARTEDP
jgi:hypothetical protein